MMNSCISFPAVAASDARILILGSMPGRASLKAREYYAHPRNLFWRFMQEFLDFTTITYDERLAALLSNRIALWDVAGRCEREGSLDSMIDGPSVIANDFPGLFLGCPDIRAVYFNGLKAQELYRRLVLPLSEIQRRSQEYILLPSTSPANASQSYSEKIRRWRDIKKYLD